VRIALAIIVLLASCDDDPDQTVEEEFASYPYRGLPAWEAMPLPTNEAVVPPSRFVADERPTVLLFTASWCPPCQASLLLDLAIVRAYRDRFRIGIALEESEADFSSSAMARLSAGIPAWIADSVRPLAVRCGLRTIPFACVVHRDRVVFRGAPSNLRHALDAFDRDPAALDAQLANELARRTSITARLAAGVEPEEFDEIVEQTSGDPHWQHAIAFAFAARPAPSGTDLVLAVALARAAVVAGGGLDFWHLDTYSLALSKAGRAEDAANVGWRVLSLCRKAQAKCMMERRRANGLIYYWQQISGQR
jgi:thiol-disulfide isomerase/thioredoxin